MCWNFCVSTENGGLYLLSMCPRYLPVCGWFPFLILSYWSNNLLIYFILGLQYRDRIVFIGNYINETFGNKILATLLYLDSTDNSKLLSVLINGVGGDVSIYHFQNTIHFHIWDFVQNLAVFLLRTWLFLQITPSLSIYDTMQILRSPVGTRCVGSAFNLSAFLLAAGDKVIFSWGTIKIRGNWIVNFNSVGKKLKLQFHSIWLSKRTCPLCHFWIFSFF